MFVRFGGGVLAQNAQLVRYFTQHAAARVLLRDRRHFQQVLLRGSVEAPQVDVDLLLEFLRKVAQCVGLLAESPQQLQVVLEGGWLFGIADMFFSFYYI